jgi:uncharacterized protein YxjI
MHNSLNNNLFLIKEHIGMFKAANNFDVYNPETSDIIMNCREDNLGFFTKIFRFSKYKMMTPFHVEITSDKGEPILSIKRNTSFFGFSPVSVFDEKGNEIGKLVRKFRFGGAKLEITDSSNNNLCTLKGNLLGWDFKISKDEIELASISKKWAGIGKELFTSADNYILSVNENVEKNSALRPLIVSAVLCIDFLLKDN